MVRNNKSKLQVKRLNSLWFIKNLIQPGPIEVPPNELNTLSIGQIVTLKN